MWLKIINHLLDNTNERYRKIAQFRVKQGKACNDIFPAVYGVLHDARRPAATNFDGIDIPPQKTFADELHFRRRRLIEGRHFLIDIHAYNICRDVRFCAYFTACYL